MLKKEIVEKISKYFKLTEFEAERVYDDIFSIIINGVKEDNIVDIADFGEFIVKYNNGKNGNGGNGSEYKKTVEFLASSQIEEELNPDLSSSRPPLTMQTEGQVSKDESSSGSSIEEELRRKREEIIGKITGPVLQKPPEMNLETPEGKKEESAQKESEIEEEKKEEPVKETVTPVSESKEEEKPVKEPEEPVPSEEEKTAEEKPSEEKAKETEKTEDLSSKSFSDYFSEVKEQKPEPEKKDVIPQSAVLLHNEITGGAGTPGETGAPGGQYPQTEPEKQALQPVEEESAEHVAGDNSYYIWYKDSESNPIDTQTLSYEYELLYQATKEAEYKSKLKIYVTSFILFFSIVLILLIFSPLLYKWFFSPAEIQNIENTQDAPDVSEHKAIPNVIQENNTTQQTLVVPPSETPNKTQEQQQVTQQNTGQQQVNQQQTQTQANQNDTKQNQTEQKTVTPPVTKKDVKADEKNSLEQAGQQKSNQIQPPKVENNLAGVTRNSMGWMDEKLKVIYIQLENGKFTIQESAWDSNSKANKRISTVESFGIKGLKGNVVKADLGAKGTWYRVRFGEFSSLEEAHQKAIELRNKEGMRIAMLFVSFIMFA